MTRPTRALMLLVLSVFSTVGLFGQVKTGTPPFGSFGGGPEVLNLANLNAHWTIPVLHKAGRGTNFSYDLGYDSSIWQPVGASGHQTWYPSSNFGWAAPSTQSLTGFISFTQTYVITCTQNGQGVTYTQSNFVYVDPLGAPHPFAGSTTYITGGGQCTCNSNCATSLIATATDGSGYTLNATGECLTSQPCTITTTNGSIISPPINVGTGVSTTTDRNGNRITTDGGGHFYDTLSSSAPVLTVAGSGTPSSPITLTYTAPSGASAVYEMKYSTYSIRTNFGCSGISDYGTNGTTTANLVSEVDLPDYNSSTNPNSRYTFTYEPTPGHSGFYTGRIASVTLPTGGIISYTYTGGSSGNITCADGSTPGFKRYTPDTGMSSYWNYSRAPGTGAASTTTITDPANNVSVIQFQGIYETQRDIYQGAISSSNLLQSIKTCYNGNASNCTSTAVSLPITQRNITMILSGGQQSEHDDFWNNYGGPTETDDYDYGSAPHGGLLKKVLASYASLGNIHAFRQTVTVQDGGGHTVSKINYNYDETSPSATTGTPQHISVPAPWGNSTSTNVYTSATQSLTKSSTYYDTGNLKATTDVNSGVTTYNYAAGTPSCGNSFPTSINEATSGLSTSMTWNCTGGVQLTSVDENSQTTTTTYNDLYFWRPASTTDPTGAVTSYCYGYLSGGSCTLSPTQMESTLTFNSNNSTVDQLKTVDGLGRTHLQQKRQAPSSSNFDTVETDYDLLGRSSRLTLPYIGTTGQTNSTVASTTTTYDALSRPLTILDGGGGSTIYFYGNPGSQNQDVLVTRSPAPSGELTKRRQFEYDALGRLSSVCEVTAGTGTWPGGTCAQNTANTGYWTKYTNDPMGNLTGVTQNAQMSGSTQTRTFVYDWMSRISSETVPEIGTNGNGTATYVYDSDSTCGTSNGDLVKAVDAAQNTICATYDALHRKLAITYPTGVYSSVTPQKHFVYDSATVNSQTMAYTKARLAEAYTCYSPCSTKLTDTGLSYTIRGELSDEYESTPHSGTYYHLTQTYWANGSPNQLGNNIVSLPAFTYLPDGEGRISQVTASAGQSPLVSSTTYNSASLPTAINLGSGAGDTDAYTWDPNTNRMTQYKFTVNGISLSSNLGWNANATLQTQNITDGFYSADTQNCSYVYDDITRLTGANCGSAAAQLFAYDPFGNVDKSGSPFAFGPTYSTATNRISCIGGSGPSCTGGFVPTYDGNGNVTNDNYHTYAWDADGHAITIDAGQSDAVNLSYDAVGRMVEQNRNSVYTQIAYSPLDQKLALMSGQTLQKALIPLGNKAMGIYNASGLLYYAHPDMLGSIRLATTPGRSMYFDTAYAPFGETYASSGGSNLDPSYTGQTNDTTSYRQDTVGTLYDFPLREYSWQGRWPSPDPLGKDATCTKDPQTQNRYAYVRNNPMTYTDPTGGAFKGDGPCNDPFDPFCGPPDPDPCYLDPALCGLGGGRGGGGGGGGGGGHRPERPRPFPWPQLPSGFFNALENDDSTCGFVQSLQCSICQGGCAQGKRVRDLLCAFKAAGSLPWTIVNYRRCRIKSNEEYIVCLDNCFCPCDTRPTER